MVLEGIRRKVRAAAANGAVSPGDPNPRHVDIINAIEHDSGSVYEEDLTPGGDVRPGYRFEPVQTGGPPPELTRKAETNADRKEGNERPDREVPWMIRKEGT